MIIHLFLILQICALGYALQSSSAEYLRKLMQTRVANSSSPAIILAGIHDAISAKVFANSGAEALFLSGFGVSATKLGLPDFGLLTQTEMEDCLRAVVQSAGEIPVIVDGDTGYGGDVNIRRTVRSFAAGGAAAITIEDQAFPKKCTYAAGEGVRVISREESVSRIKAVMKARDEVRSLDGRDILIVARTDCRAALGFDEALQRCLLFEELGADIVYAENLQSKEEYERLRKELKPTTGTILAQLQLGNESQKLWSADEVGSMNYDFALFGVTALQSYIQNLNDVAQALFQSDKKDGLVSVDRDSIRLSTFDSLKRTIGFSEYEKF